MAYGKITIFLFFGAVVLLACPAAFAGPEEDLFESEESGSAEADSGDEESDEGDAAEEGKEKEESKAAPAEALMLSKGAMQAGGTIAFQIDVHKANGQTDGGGQINFAPNAGYFLIDKLELMAGLGFSIPFGDANPDTKNIFFDMGARYFLFNISQFYMYAGATFGMNFYIVKYQNEDEDEVKETWPTIMISVPAGFLFALNRYVAADLGLRFEFDIGVGDNPDDFWMHRPMGYFGVQGFFTLFD